MMTMMRILELTLVDVEVHRRDTGELMIEVRGGDEHAVRSVVRWLESGWKARKGVASHTRFHDSSTGRWIAHVRCSREVLQ
ncbi:hypothetical protein [Burkholderia cenocepacia]|nr:hypothetical protein [Burkholderia cenocepacia]MEB2499555.1 hypothetical protein [Burkholderia cenocepacia]MEB2557230.1 hypothetical protein [Burkholderia cenocepacia]